ncbi:partial Methyl-accepting chemotaxis protein I, partial [Planctomycetaceae bacterium]
MDFLRNLKTRSKLFLSFTVLIVFVLGLGLLSINRIGEMKSMLQTLYADRFVPAVDLGKINNHLAFIRIGALQIMNETEKAKKQEIWNKAAESEQETNRLIEKYGATYMEGDEKKVFDDMKGAWLSYNEARTITYKLAMEGDNARAKDNALNNAGPKFKHLDDDIVRLIEIQDEVGQALNKEAEADYAFTRNVVILATVLSVSIGAALALILTALIAKPLADVTSVANKLADGDLTIDIDARGKDEIGQLTVAFRNMVGKLREVVADVRAVSDNVASGAQELSSGAQQISQGATEQAASIEETSSSMEQMSANIRQNSGADQINRALQQLDQVIQQNASGAEELASTSEELSSQSEQLQKAITFFKIAGSGPSSGSNVVSMAKAKTAHKAKAPAHPAQARTPQAQAATRGV